MSILKISILKKANFATKIITMIHTMRWFGPNDPVSLMDLRQSGCTGVVSALHQIPVGEVWSQEDIQQRIDIIEKDNDKYSKLKWLVVESLPVHEDIKKGLPSKEKYIENYICSLENLAAKGIKTVCYNFMPVLDWSRTKLDYTMPDGSKALRFVWIDFVAFDLYILKRPGVENFYDIETKTKATERFSKLTESQKLELKNTVLLGLPGSNEAFHLETFQGLLDNYKYIGDEELRKNLYYFIAKVAPKAHKLGIGLCIHPDDPPFPLLGLPRVVSTESDLAQLMKACDHKANGITFCTGSLGVRPDNNLTQMIKRFADRIHFVHLRTTKREATLDNGQPEIFHEAAHLDGDVDMYEVIKAILEEEQNRKLSGIENFEIPMRPDHGHQMLDDLQKTTYPGYSAIGRLKGLAELRGVEFAIKRQLNF
jgi:mannonate dehydratase